MTDAHGAREQAENGENDVRTRADGKGDTRRYVRFFHSNFVTARFVILQRQLALRFCYSRYWKVFRFEIQENELPITAYFVIINLTFIAE